MLTIGTPDYITVKRYWYSDNNEFIKQFKDTYEFDYTGDVEGWYDCNYTKYSKSSDKFYCEIDGPHGIAEGFYEKFVKSLLALNGKKRKRKSGYTKYEVNYDWD